MNDRRPLIVLVHEDFRILAALESLLAERENAVATFTSRGRSLEFIRRSKPDLVFAQEPETKPQGIEFLEQLKQCSSTTEGVFLPSPLDLEKDALSIRRIQADGILKVVERLLFSLSIPDTRRFAIGSPEERRAVEA
jgi:two-component SAPR family response regulator